MERYEFIGNAGQDAKLEYSRSGKPVCTFDVAVQTARRDEQGNRLVVWRRVETWEKLAEQCAACVKKGTKVYVDGTPKVEAWISKDRSSAKGALVCQARTVEFLSKADATAQAGSYTPVEDDGEMPF